MRWLLLVVVLAGCSELPAESNPNPTEPLYDGQSDDEADGYETDDETWFDCDELDQPETWFGHGDGSLWCVVESGASGAGGSVVAPGLGFVDDYVGRNGSAGHAQGTPTTGHVLVLCWSGVCYADVTMTIRSNGTTVATLTGTAPVVDVILGSGTWIVLDGALDQAIPSGGVLDTTVTVDGAGALMLRGYSGDGAPWFSIGN